VGHSPGGARPRGGERSEAGGLAAGGSEQRAASVGRAAANNA
jgi:hypothetical protein